MFLISFLVAAISLLPCHSFAHEERGLAETGELSGSVFLLGDAPLSPVLPVTKNPEFCGKDVTDRVLIINSNNRGVKDTLVYLDVERNRKSSPARTVISAFSCLFNPRVAVAAPEGLLVLYNSDPILHSPRATSSTGQVLFNFALPEHRGELQHQLKGEGLTGPIRLQCGIHPHMYGYIALLDHPYYAVTDDQGRFSIRDIPAGKYDLIAWHQGVRPKASKPGDANRNDSDSPAYEEPYILRQSVEVGAGRETIVEFLLSVRK